MRKLRERLALLIAPHLKPPRQSFLVIDDKTPVVIPWPMPTDTASVYWKATG